MRTKEWANFIDLGKVRYHKAVKTG